MSLSCHFTKHARLCLGWQSLHLLPHCGLLMGVPEHPGYGMFPGMASPRASELVPHSAQLSSPACSISTHHDTNLCKTLFLLYCVFGYSKGIILGKIQTSHHTDVKYPLSLPGPKLRLLLDTLMGGPSPCFPPKRPQAEPPDQRHC